VALGLTASLVSASCRKNSQERAVRNLSMHLLAAPVSNAPQAAGNRGLRDQPMRIMPTVPVSQHLLIGRTHSRPVADAR